MRSSWTRIQESPGEQRAWLDADVEQMGRIQARAFREYQRRMRE